MGSEIAYIVGFFIFAIDLGAITWLVSFGLEVAAGGELSKRKFATFFFIMILKVIMVVLAVAGALVWVKLSPLPFFLGSLTALLLFSFYLLTKNLKRTPQG